MIQRALYSLSTAPLKQFNGSRDCGWFNERYNWIGLALSVNYSRSIFNEVAFVSDSYGAMLGKIFKIEFTEISTGFDNGKMPPSLWSLAKIYAIAQEEKPFLHIDGDVFLRMPINAMLLEQQVIVQSLELFKNYKYYMDTIKAMKLRGFQLTPLFRYGNKRKVQYATNNGIVGGNNVALLNEYARCAIEFVNLNINKWHKNPDAFGCTVVEQWMLAVQCNKSGVDVSPLLGASELWSNLQQQARSLGYHHYISSTKRNEDRCKRMEIIAKKRIPQQVKLINSYFNGR